jgi:hypothetical protein
VSVKKSIGKKLVFSPNGSGSGSGSGSESSKPTGFGIYSAKPAPAAAKPAPAAAKPAPAPYKSNPAGYLSNGSQQAVSQAQGLSQVGTLSQTRVNSEEFEA